MGKTAIIIVATMTGLAMGWEFTFPDYKRTALGDSVDLASMKLLKEVYEASSDKNVVASPLGVLTLLSLYAAGSEGENREEIMKLLGSADYKQLSESYSELSDRFARMDRSYLNLANKLFVSDKYSLNDDFSKTARSFKSEVDSINFANYQDAARIMNEWSSKNTQGKINHPVSDSDIDPAAAVTLLNVIFFQGHWHVPFNASETKERDFHTSRGKSVKKPMMHLLQSLYYHEDADIGARMIELPYKEDKFRMIILLPDDEEGLPEVVKKISEKGLLEDVFRMYPAGADVDLDMPKFEIKSRHDLNDILPKVGVSSIFERESNGIVKDRGVKVDKAFQEAFVKVDEEGATAGAFTATMAKLTMGWHSTYKIYERTTLGDSVDRASMKLLKEVYEASSDKNVVASPLGVLTLLTLYAAGSEGQNREEIMKFLGYTDFKELSKSYSELTDRFTRMDPSYLNLASKVFVSDKYFLNNDFSKSARSLNVGTGSIDFAHPKSAADIINEWSSANTQGKISHPVSASDIDAAAAVALFNVIFFQGHWHVAFNASETIEREFHTSRDKSVKKPMMHLLQPLHYYKDKDIGARMIELPYKEDKFRMIVVLPDDVEGLPEVVRKISEKGMLEDVFRMHPVNAEIDLDMPKFEIKSKHDFNDVLAKVGVSSIFHKPANGIVKDHGVVVDKVFQEAFVKVDEEGATAGAFTGAVAVLTSSHSRPPPPISFKVDRPFLYAILHEDIVLFAGTYSS